jgi:hypothetical protein
MTFDKFNGSHPTTPANSTNPIRSIPATARPKAFVSPVCLVASAIGSTTTSRCSMFGIEQDASGDLTLTEAF